MPERRAGVEKAGFGRLVCFWRLSFAVGGLRTFFCRVAAFLMERKRNCAGTVWRCLWGRALFACFSCGAFLLFILVFALLGWCGGVFVRVN